MKKYSGASYKLPQKKDYRSLKTDMMNLKFDYASKILGPYLEKINIVYLDETSLGHSNRPQRCW